MREPIKFHNLLNQEQMLENLTELIHKFGGKETDKLLTNLVSDKQSVLPEM